MNGWYRLKATPWRRKPGRWHQGMHVFGALTTLCGVEAWEEEIEGRDYRWTPPARERCRHPQCQQYVEP